MITSGKQEYSKSEFAKQFGPLENLELENSWSSEFAGWLKELKLPEELFSDLELLYLPFCNYIIQSKLISPEKPLIIGINGSQGSGKTTFTHLLGNVLRNFFHYKVINCSIDDFYLTRHEREKLSREVHPLLITRGVPGTHDVDLAISTFNNLINATNETVTNIPVFDKAIDDRKPNEDWMQFQGQPDIILFEGWCIGANAVTEQELIQPINELERNHDKDGAFRRYANENLRNKYARLFEMIDQLIMLKVPGFEQVFEWRWIQEQKLAEKYSGTKIKNRIMTEEETHYFISHFERITRQMQTNMPLNADVVFSISKSHSIERIQINREDPTFKA
jgi:D-glycerate 3-kinase